MTSHLLPASLLSVFALGSCATIAGTAASPLTGGVDAAVTYTTPKEWYWVPVAFIGGTVVAPFVAFYGGINYDASHMSGNSGYWRDFDKNFRPFRTLARGDIGG